MCSINHELKAIYIHVPKCGGLSVQILLDKHYGFKTAYFTHENHSDYVLDKGDELQTIDTGQEKVQGFLRINKMGILRYFESSETHSEKAAMENILQVYICAKSIRQISVCLEVYKQINRKNDKRKKRQT